MTKTHEAMMMMLGAGLLVCCGPANTAEPSSGAAVRLERPTPPTVAQLPGLAQYPAEPGRVRTTTTPDLDGDGRADLLVTAVGYASATHNFATSVFLTRGAVGVRVGSFWAHAGTGVRPGSQRHGGLADLLVSSRLPDGEQETRFCFDGARYVPAAQRVRRYYDHQTKTLRHLLTDSHWEPWSSLGGRPNPQRSDGPAPKMTLLIRQDESSAAYPLTGAGLTVPGGLPGTPTLISVGPPGAPGRITVEQRTEVSVTITDEGAHLDLRRWLHGRSAWTELAPSAGGYGLVAQEARFPRHANAQLVDGARRALAILGAPRQKNRALQGPAGAPALDLQARLRRWLPLARRCGASVDRPCRLAPNAIELRITRVSPGGARQVRRVRMELDMGC